MMLSFTCGIARNGHFTNFVGEVMLAL